MGGQAPLPSLPTGGQNRGAEKWALGPAMGFVAHSQKLLWGVFNQNLFSFAGDSDRTDVYVSIFQPILNYGLGAGWSAGVSESTFTYDWESEEWSSIPLGASLSRLVKSGGLPIQLSMQYEHDFARPGPRNTFRWTAKFLFPI